ncbi:hypothetical protein KC19_4G211500 [Ceratodon purpureus]|uniref:Uncharacterized protein n=1 Tax=Ceratodon purpureus TaxID=3225 RepID=A0A8T0IEK8_CERPU|nr:hypothetical protein KC19_4G211500 [Ceratodon purpureus]
MLIYNLYKHKLSMLQDDIGKHDDDAISVVFDHVKRVHSSIIVHHKPRQAVSYTIKKGLIPSSVEISICSSRPGERARNGLCFKYLSQHGSHCLGLHRYVRPSFCSFAIGLLSGFRTSLGFSSDHNVIRTTTESMPQHSQHSRSNFHNQQPPSSPSTKARKKTDATTNPKQNCTHTGKETLSQPQSCTAHRATLQRLSMHA